MRIRHSAYTFYFHFVFSRSFSLRNLLPGKKTMDGETDTDTERNCNGKSYFAVSFVYIFRNTVETPF